MNIEKLLTAIGGIIAFLGLICLPIWNLFEIPYVADPAYPKGGGWIALAQSGIFARPGIILMILGGSLFIIGKLLPKRFKKNDEDLFVEKIQKDLDKRKNT